MRNQDLPLARHLLKDCKCDPNTTNAKNQTALFSAAYSGFLEGAKLLWEHKADVDMQDKMGWTALMMAAYEGH